MKICERPDCNVVLRGQQTKWCSKACGNWGWREARRKVKTCLECGRTFSGRRKNYCSQECAENARREREVFRTPSAYRALLLEACMELKGGDCFQCGGPLSPERELVDISPVWAEFLSDVRLVHSKCGSRGRRGPSWGADPQKKARSSRYQKMLFEALLALQGDLCGLCKRPVANSYFEIDHIIPVRSLPRKARLSDVQAVHKECHKDKTRWESQGLAYSEILSRFEEERIRAETESADSEREEDFQPPPQWEFMEHIELPPGQDQITTEYIPEYIKRHQKTHAERVGHPVKWQMKFLGVTDRETDITKGLLYLWM